MHHYLAYAGAAGFFAVCLLATRSPARSGRNAWGIPAVFAAVFLAFSVLVITKEGPSGFWPEHTRSFWGNQIWFDLLAAAAVAWCALVSRARQVGMHTLPWLLLIAASGSFGLLAFQARILYLESRQ